MTTALVTGASRGLGRALATRLAQDGWNVIVDARDGDALRVATGDIAGITAIPGDVTDPAHRRALVEAAAGRLDLLVNNASLLGPSPQPRLVRYPADVLRRVYEVNVLAPLALIQEAEGVLGEGARVVNVTSDASVEPYDGWGGYGSSKAALDHATAILAAEQPGWRVWAVDPGDMRTQMHQEAFPGEDISDRPEPSSVVPAFLALIESDRPSGRVRLSDVEVAP